MCRKLAFIKKGMTDSNMKAQLARDCFGDDDADLVGDNHSDCNMDLAPPQRKRTRSPPGKISPLLINHVLEQIFSGASISDLSNFRLVCREWNAMATKCLQSRLDVITIGCRNANHIHSLHYHHLISTSFRPITSSPSPIVPSSPLTVAGTDAASSAAPLLSTLVTPSMNAEQLNRFLKVISCSTNPPFVKYEIVSSFFTPENQRVLHRFFQLSSPFIQVLKISLDNRAPGDFSPNFLTNVTFPKLKSVVFEVLRQFTLQDQPGVGVGLPAEVTNTSDLRDNAVSYRILSAISFSASSLESLELSLQRKCNGEGQRQYNVDGTPNFERDRQAGLSDGGTCPCQHFSLSNDGSSPPSSPSENLNFPFENNLNLENSNASRKSHNFSGISSIPNSITNSNVTRGENPVVPISTSVKCHLPLPVTTGYQSTPPRISNSPKLKRLHLRLRNTFIHQTCITSLLERLASTLEELRFTEEGHGSRVVVEFPKMTKLSMLTISSICEFEQNFVTILPFSYSEQLPSLSGLNLWDCFGTEKRYEQLFLSVSPSLTLTKLVLPSQFRNVSLAQNIPRVFPNLKSLTVVFSTRPDNLAVIEAVFQTCGESLEELHLITDMDIQNQNVDHVLTGLPKEICRQMRIEESFTLPLYFHGMARNSSLVNLKRLKRLIFQLEHRYSRAPLITDVTGYLAFMEMPNLEYLRFTRYGMTWNCCEALSRKCRTDILSPYGNNVFEIETFDFDFEGI